MSYGRANPRFKPREARLQVDPAKAWRDLCHEAKAFVAAEGEGGRGNALVMLERRRIAMGATFPADGEGPKAASNALLELVRTWPQLAENQRGWRLASLRGVAGEVDALLDQHNFATAALGRRCLGDDD